MEIKKLRIIFNTENSHSHINEKEKYPETDYYVKVTTSTPESIPQLQIFYSQISPDTIVMTGDSINDIHYWDFSFKDSLYKKVAINFLVFGSYWAEEEYLYPKLVDVIIYKEQ
jgi:hypothetical protein